MFCPALGSRTGRERASCKHLMRCALRHRLPHGHCVRLPTAGCGNARTPWRRWQVHADTPCARGAQPSRCASAWPCGTCRTRMSTTTTGPSTATCTSAPRSSPGATARCSTRSAGPSSAARPRRSTSGAGRAADRGVGQYCYIAILPIIGSCPSAESGSRLACSRVSGARYGSMYRRVCASLLHSSASLL